MTLDSAMNHGEKTKMSLMCCKKCWNWLCTWNTRRWNRICKVLVFSRW